MPIEPLKRIKRQSNFKSKKYMELVNNVRVLDCQYMKMLKDASDEIERLRAEKEFRDASSEIP